MISLENNNGPMDQSRLHSIVIEFCGGGQVRQNVLQTSKDDLSLWVISDPAHDRMRIICPIVDVEQIPAQALTRMLEANFHTALDGRYAISDRVVYSAFIHPLSPLDRGQVESAIRQVVSLAQTFGTDYSGGELEFRG